MHPARARLTIDLDALAANHARLKSLAGKAELAPVVKADGYGLGALTVAGRLAREGATSFFVARLDEGEALREALPEADIYVLDGAVPGSADALLRARLIPVLNSPAQLETYAAAARARGGTPAPCAVHLDTGMNRLGFRPEELKAAADAPDRLAGLRVELIVSHLACADQEEHPLNARQVGRLRAAEGLFPTARRSLANSAGLHLGSPYHFDMTRPGVSLYGGGPFGRPDPHLKAVARLEAPILQVRAVAAGDTVGYGAAFTAQRPMRAAILAAGYADGVIRACGERGAVWFEGTERAVLGRVSMDLMAVDVTGCETARPGAMVEIFGPNRSIDEAAAAAGTIAYELLTRLGGRAERVIAGG